MVALETTIPESIRFSDRWLYQLQKIYSKADTMDLHDWTAIMKIKRIKQFENCLS